MSRYIDADELIFFGFDNPDCDNLFEFVPKEFIDNAPTADVVPMEFHEKCMELEIQKRANMVEVVRCKDCIHWSKELEACYIHDFCEIFQSDYYCASGERKEDERVH